MTLILIFLEDLLFFYLYIYYIYTLNYYTDFLVVRITFNLKLFNVFVMIKSRYTFMGRPELFLNENNF